MAEAKKAAKAAGDTFTQAAEQAAEAFKTSFPQFTQFPGAYSDFAQKGIAQAKQNYDRMKATAEEATGLLESSYSTATKGASDYALKIIDIMRYNVNAQFDFASALFSVKSPSEAIELSSTHARKSFETLSAQGKELASLAQKVSTETAEPIKAGFNKALRVVS